jgi:hypothetical protein
MKKTFVTAFISIAMVLCMLAGFITMPVAAYESMPERFITATNSNHWGRSDLRSYLSGNEKVSNTLPLDTSGT